MNHLDRTQSKAGISQHGSPGVQRAGWANADWSSAAGVLRNPGRFCLKPGVGPNLGAAAGRAPRGRPSPGDYTREHPDSRAHSSRGLPALVNRGVRRGTCGSLADGDARRQWQSVLAQFWQGGGQGEPAARNLRKWEAGPGSCSFRTAGECSRSSGVRSKGRGLLELQPVRWFAGRQSWRAARHPPGRRGVRDRRKAGPPSLLTGTHGTSNSCKGASPSRDWTFAGEGTDMHRPARAPEGGNPFALGVRNKDTAHGWNTCIWGVRQRPAHAAPAWRQ